jgi:L-fucose/D-arabinose isomerase
MVAVHGEFVSFGAEEDEKLAAIEQDNWPHAFAGYVCQAADIEFVQLTK